MHKPQAFLAVLLLSSNCFASPFNQQGTYEPPKFKGTYATAMKTTEATTPPTILSYTPQPQTHNPIMSSAPVNTSNQSATYAPTFKGTYNLPADQPRFTTHTSQPIPSFPTPSTAPAPVVNHVGAPIVARSTDDLDVSHFVTPNINGHTFDVVLTEYAKPGTVLPNRRGPYDAKSPAKIMYHPYHPGGNPGHAALLTLYNDNVTFGIQGKIGTVDGSKTMLVRPHYRFANGNYNISSETFSDAAGRKLYNFANANVNTHDNVASPNNMPLAELSVDTAGIVCVKTTLNGYTDYTMLVDNINELGGVVFGNLGAGPISTDILFDALKAISPANATFTAFFDDVKGKF